MTVIKEARGIDRTCRGRGDEVRQMNKEDQYALNKENNSTMKRDHRDANHDTLQSQEEERTNALKVWGEMKEGLERASGQR